MAYFLGRDVEVAITTEHDGTQHTGISADYGITSAAAATDTAGDMVIPNREVSTLFDEGEAANPVQDVISVDMTVGSVDEDIAYMGQKTALKAEIKKENTITITKKKNDAFFDKLFNTARYGLSKPDSSAATINDGLSQPDNVFGYRVHVKLKTGSSGELISFPLCTLTEHSVTLNADGVQEETITFMGHVTPIIGTDQSLAAHIAVATP